MKLIKSSIYKVNGVLARYTGVVQPGEPSMYHFSAHGSTIRASLEEISKATPEEYKAYLGK